MRFLPLFLGLLVALPAWAAFPRAVQPVQLAFGQKEAVVFFEADGPIKQAKPLCECTSLHWVGNKLTARVDTSGFAQDVEKQIDATTADGVTTRLTMRFAVPQAIVLSARSFIWKMGQPATTKSLRITIPAGSPVRQIKEASISGDAFDYTPRIIKEGAEYAVDIIPRRVDKKALNRLIIKTDSTDPRYEGIIVYLSIQP